MLRALVGINVLSSILSVFVVQKSKNFEVINQIAVWPNIPGVHVCRFSGVDQIITDDAKKALCSKFDNTQA